MSNEVEECSGSRENTMSHEVVRYSCSCYLKCSGCRMERVSVGAIHPASASQSRGEADTMCGYGHQAGMNTRSNMLTCGVKAHNMCWGRTLYVSGCHVASGGIDGCVETLFIQH